MAATATVRDLRNHFPRVRKLVEAEGEVVVTDQGTPRFRLTLSTPADEKKIPPPKDYDGDADAPARPAQNLNFTPAVKEWFVKFARPSCSS